MKKISNKLNKVDARFFDVTDYDFVLTNEIIQHLKEAEKDIDEGRVVSASAVLKELRKICKN